MASNRAAIFNFDLGETADAIRETVHDFSTNEIAPRAAEIDRSNTFPRDLWPKIGALGLHGITVEEEYGGSGLGYLEHCIAVEEISRASASVGLAYGAHSNLCVNQIRRNGNEAQKRKYLPKLISGEHVGSLAMSEPGAGSDVVSMKTRAEKKGDRYVLNGNKMWITNGPHAETLVVYAKTDVNAGPRGMTAFIIEKGMKGFSTAQKLDKLGMRSSDTAQIFFDNVRVPKRNRIGEEGQGFTYQMIQFQEERLWGAAACLKAHEFIINATIDYTRNRKAFGGSILDNQVVHFKLAEMQTEVELLRSLIYRAAEALVAGEDVTRLATMAKLKAGRLGRELTDACLQYWGGMGFTNETPVSRAYRDSRLTSIGGGADEVMLMVLCKMMGTLPGLKKGNA